MSTYTYLLAGVPDTEQRMLTRTTALHAGVTVRATAVVVPGIHGATPGGGVVFDAGLLTMEWELIASSWDGLDVEYATLLALLGQPGGVEITRRAIDDTVAHDTTAIARLKSISEPHADAASPLTTVTVVLDLPDVFWRGTIATSPQAPASGDTVTEVTSLAGSSAPVVDAVVRVSGPATALQILDVASGTGLSWSGALPEGEYLYLDAATLRAWRSTSWSEWAPGAADESLGLDYPGPGPLEIWPLPGAAPEQRTPRLSVSGAGRGSSTALAVRAAPAYL